MTEKGTVWVVGASSGLGCATAEAFAQAGWRVVAGARSFAPEAQAKPGQDWQSGSRLHLLALDVTEEKSCEDFRQEALQISPRVDVLCYAAGLLVLGSCEETSPAEYRRVMDTNFLGMVRMVQKALPTMRAQGKGKVVLFSSMNGLVATPFQSAYVASKHAIQGYAQCLAMEGKPFHIQVSVVEPGDHQGGSQRYRPRAENGREASPYKAEYESACAVIHGDEAKGLSPQRLGQKVVRHASRRKMRSPLRVAKLDQRAAVWLKTLLPSGFFISLMRAYYVKRRG